MKQLFSISIYFLVVFSAFTQPLKQYPKGYFTFPIRPGQQNFLSGNMGELRGNHFHAGLDIKTQGEIGLPIYASADGYVSRIKISPFGYGRALYITHPNGYTTVYAHLNRLSPQLEKYVIEQQYKRTSFSVDLYPKKGDFTVKQKEIVAYSGNSGSSRGPHLHWEIRDQSSAVLNPLLFGFKEVKDNIKPSIYQVALTPISEDARINGNFKTYFFRPNYSTQKAYKVNSKISAYGTLGLSLKANDKLNGANNRNGIAKIEVFQDDVKIYEYHNTRVSFSETRFINAHIDYSLYRNGRGRFHRCYVGDGNQLNFYEKDDKNGKLLIQDSLDHKIFIKIWDAYNNQSSLSFILKGQIPLIGKKPITAQNKKATVKTSTFENILKVSCQDCLTESTLTIYKDGKKRKKKASYYKDNYSVFLIDLRKTLPDSIYLGDTLNINASYRFAIPGGRAFSLFENDYTLLFRRNSLYDTLYLQSRFINDTLRIGSPTTPIHQSIMVTLKAKGNYSSKARIYGISGRSKNFVGGTWDNNKISFRTRDFGTYTILEDTLKPEIRYLGRYSGEYRLRIRDPLAGIQSYNAYLNGKWLLLEYDFKKSTITTRRKDPTKPLKGELKVIVVDEVGNENIYTRNL